MSPQPDLFDSLADELGASRVLRVLPHEATRLPVSEDLDLVVLVGDVAALYPDREHWGAVLRRAAAVLGTGGHLAFTTTDPRGAASALADAWLDLAEMRGELVLARKPVDPRDSEDRGWRDLARIDADLTAGMIDETTWHRRVLDLLEPAYLGATTPHAQSGKGGGPADWEYARSLVVDAVDRDGTFLDVGCANGLLMQDVRRWAAARGFDLEPHGVEIGAGLSALARQRCPEWADRIHTANAHGWLPPQRYDFVRTGLDYVPVRSRRSYVDHLMTHVVAPGGRLVIGVHNRPDDDPLPTELELWGYVVAGTSTRPHRQPGTAYAVLWINRAASAAQ